MHLGREVEKIDGQGLAISEMVGPHRLAHLSPRERPKCARPATRWELETCREPRARSRDGARVVSDKRCCGRPNANTLSPHRQL